MIDTSAVSPAAAVITILGSAFLAVVYAFARGKLVHRSQVTDVRDAADKRAAFAEATAEKRIAEVREDRDSRLAEMVSQRDDWREAFRASDARADTLSVQVGQVIDGMKTVVALVEAMAKAAERGRDASQ